MNKIDVDNVANIMMLIPILFLFGSVISFTARDSKIYKDEVRKDLFNE